MESYTKMMNKEEAMSFKDETDYMPGAFLLMLIIFFLLYRIIFTGTGWFWFIIFYIGNIFVGFNAKETFYLKDIDRMEEVRQYIREIKEQKPNLIIHGQAYHIVEHVDEDGDVTEREKKITHHVEEPLQISSFKDKSPKLTNETYIYDIIRLNFAKTWIFGDDKTQIKFNEIKNYLTSQVQNEDEEYQVFSVMELSGFKDKILGMNNINRKPFFINHRYYNLSVWINLSWIIRFWLQRHSVEAHYTFVKEIFA